MYGVVLLFAFSYHVNSICMDCPPESNVQRIMQYLAFTAQQARFDEVEPVISCIKKPDNGCPPRFGQCVRLGFGRSTGIGSARNLVYLTELVVGQGLQNQLMEEKHIIMKKKKKSSVRNAKNKKLHMHGRKPQLAYKKRVSQKQLLLLRAG